MRILLNLFSFAFISTLGFVEVANAQGHVRITNENIPASIEDHKVDTITILFINESRKGFKRFLLQSSDKSTYQILPQDKYAVVSASIQLKGGPKITKICNQDNQENPIDVDKNTIVSVDLSYENNQLMCTVTHSEKSGVAR